MNIEANDRYAHGGKAIYGARLGILMLEARFPRIPGDMGNAETWPFPVLYKVVAGASPQRVVREKAAGLLPDFITAAKELAALGADAITTNCGFLSLYQKELAAAVTVPVATSSLMQVPMIASTLPLGKRVGVLTVNAASLTPQHLTAVGVDPSVPVVGTDGLREFTRVMIGNELTMNVAAAELDILDAGRTLLGKYSDIGAVVLECTNMVPYARTLREALGVPVYDIYSLITWFHAGLAPRDFGHPGRSTRAWRER
jgi:Asp/Glu/hydantoin racemase